MTTTTDPDDALTRRLGTLKGNDGTKHEKALREHAARILRDRTFTTRLSNLKALADDRRLAALTLINESTELCQCEIQAALGLTHATVNHHMRVLADAGLVEGERRGKWIYYRLTETGLAALK